MTLTGVPGFTVDGITFRCWTVRLGALPGATVLEWRSDDGHAAWRSGKSYLASVSGQSISGEFDTLKSAMVASINGGRRRIAS